MDPDEALAALRAMCAQWRGLEPTRQMREGDDRAEALVEQFEALDGWLTGGGFLPKPWAPYSAAPVRLRGGYVWHGAGHDAVADDLHHEDGSHRNTARSATGEGDAAHLRALTAHLYDHERAAAPAQERT